MSETSHHPQRYPSGARTSKQWVSLGITFLLGAGGGYLLWGRAPAASGTTNEDPSSLIRQQVNPSDGYALSVRYGDIGRQLVDAGAISYDRLIQHYAGIGAPIAEAQRAVLNEGSDTQIVINEQNAHFLLNFFWALGLTNENSILTQGRMTDLGTDRIGRFASTGGWTLGAKPATELYASIPIISLTDTQQARLEKVVKEVYRPCCNNPTDFPDCNHGMAMLALQTLLASQDASEAEMFTAAKYANAFWYPEQSLELAIYFKVAEGLDFDDIDAEKLVGSLFSSGAGFQVVHQWLEANGLLEQAPSGGSGCAI
jgi:hypothetical protein